MLAHAAGLSHSQAIARPSHSFTLKHFFLLQQWFQQLIPHLNGFALKHSTHAPFTLSSSPTLLLPNNKICNNNKIRNNNRIRNRILMMEKKHAHSPRKTRSQLCSRKSTRLGGPTFQNLVINRAIAAHSSNLVQSFFDYFTT